MKLIRLTNIDDVALIDDQDQESTACHLWRFNGWYVVTTVPHPEGGWKPRPGHPNQRQKRQYILALSRFIMGLQYGDRREVDHQNHNTLDNRRSNLLVVTHGENGQNVRSKRGSSSRYRGVSWDIKGSKWKAYAKSDGKLHHLGFYTLEEEAARVAAEWRAANMPNSVEDRRRLRADA